MIAGIFHQGSGLGNQLHRYVATRVLALDKGYEWGMIGQNFFKGKDFMKIDYAHWHMTETPKEWNEKKIVENGIDIRGYDPEINFVEDNTIIDGEFQDEKYFEHRMPEIRDWLQTEPMEMPNNLCVIGFRGGEYSLFNDLFLPIDYWNEAIDIMLKINPDMQFEVHTDDPVTAELFFPGYPIIHEIGINWRSMRYANHAIIANSSFYILPRLLNDGFTIAPRYWARHNTKTWSMPQNYYKSFKYI